MMSELVTPPDACADRKVPKGKAPARTAAKPSPSQQSGLLFHEPWWLAAVTQGHFEEVRVTSGDQVVGRLPFVITRKMGLTTLRMPPFTHRSDRWWTRARGSRRHNC